MLNSATVVAFNLMNFTDENMMINKINNYT